jgi:hypothetical protein
MSAFVERFVYPGSKEEFRDRVLYEVVALKLAKGDWALAQRENAAYRVCANEPCQRMFVRQAGRAQHGQHRTRGVRFCSSTCARAQSQRDKSTSRLHLVYDGI